MCNWNILHLELGFTCILANLSQKHTHTHTHRQPFYGSVDFVQDNPGEPVPEETFTHYTHRGHQISLSASSIYYDPWHPPYSIHMLYSLFPQSLSKFSLVYILAWHPPLHTPYISSPNPYLLFAAHAHTIAIWARKCQIFHKVVKSEQQRSSANYVNGAHVTLVETLRAPTYISITCKIDHI